MEVSGLLNFMFGSFQGSTSLALIIWECPLSCFAVTLLPTIKSSCSYLRTMHHSPGRHIPIEDWISGVHMDSQGFNMIKTLPVRNLAIVPLKNKGYTCPGCVYRHSVLAFLGWWLKHFYHFSNPGWFWEHDGDDSFLNCENFLAVRRTLKRR